MSQRQIKTFSVEEYHRGEWQPLMSKDKDGKKSPKRVKISVEHAELLTNDALAQISEKQKTTLFRYVEFKESKKDDSRMKRPEMTKFCGDNNIKFDMKDKNDVLEEKIKKFKAENV